MFKLGETVPEVYGDGPYIIYKIVHDASGRVYIGQTRAGFLRRMRGHIQKANSAKISNESLAQAIILYGPESFTACVIQVGHADQDSANAAEAAAIQHYQSHAADLGFNLTFGGAGVAFCRASTRAKIAEANRNPSPETRAKMSASKRGKTHTPEARANMSASKRGKTHTPEARAKIAEAHLGKKFTPEHRAKLSEAKRNVSPETRAKMSEAARRRKASPETRAKIAEANRNRSPETRAKLSEANRNPSSETRAKLSEAARKRAPEMRAKMSEALRSPEACAKRVEVLRSPEARAKMSEARKAYYAQRRAAA